MFKKYTTFLFSFASIIGQCGINFKKVDDSLLKLWKKQNLSYIIVHCTHQVTDIIGPFAAVIN
jgi:hypothetical protein